MTNLQKLSSFRMFFKVFVKEGKETEKELVKEFKRLTGYNGGDVAEKYGVSRPFVHQALNNHSLTYKASSAFFLNSMIGEKISVLKEQVRELEVLRVSIGESVTNGEGSDCE